MYLIILTRNIKVSNVSILPCQIAVYIDRRGTHMFLTDKLDMSVMVGIDPASDGLARASRLGIATTAEGVEGLIAMPEFQDIEVVFDATSAGAHRHNAARLGPLREKARRPHAGSHRPYVVPSVNLEQHLDAGNVNMVTCGGQATIPVIAAINSVTPVHYGEIVASISSKSAGPGTRANIDEFTETTSDAIVEVGGASQWQGHHRPEPGRTANDHARHGPVPGRPAHRGRTGPRRRCSCRSGSTRWPATSPGTGLSRPCNSRTKDAEVSGLIPEGRGTGEYTRVSVFLEVEGAAHYLPEYAGNLDIMTSAALRVAEQLVSTKQEVAS